MLRLAAAMVLVAALRGARAAAVSCPSGMLSVGSTPDGEWTVCELPMSVDPLSGKTVPRGELRYIHANGSVAVFPKSSEAMYGCDGQTENETAGCFLGLGTGSAGVATCQASCQSELLKRNGDADPGYEQVKQLFSGMVFDGGWDERDPAHQGSWKGRADQSEPGFNVHTYVGSRGTTQLPAFDSVGGDVESVGMPSMNQFQETKYHRSDAVFKDPLSRFEQREGLFGGYLPVISLQFKIADHPPPKPGHCSTTPQPCPSHPGRTFCSSSTAPNQCDHPPAPCPPCPSPAPPPPAAGAGKKTVLVFHLHSHRSLCQDRLGTTHKSVCVCVGGCYLASRVDRICRLPRRGYERELPPGCLLQVSKNATF